MTTYSYTTLDDPFDSNGGTTSALGINDQGQIVGLYQVSGNFPNRGMYGFVEKGGIYTTIDDPLASTAPPGAHTTVAFGINNAGQIVGYYDYLNVTDVTRGFLDNGGSYTDLIDAAAMGTGTQAFGINDKGQVVGSLTMPA